MFKLKRIPKGNTAATDAAEIAAVKAFLARQKLNQLLSEDKSTQETNNHDATKESRHQTLASQPAAPHS